VLAGLATLGVFSKAQEHREEVWQVLAFAVFFLTLAVLVTMRWTVLSKRLGQEIKTTCAIESVAVSYLGWYGTVHSFQFANAAYAQAFMTANQGKIVR
jgi:hypothetical protein